MSIRFITLSLILTFLLGPAAIRPVSSRETLPAFVLRPMSPIQSDSVKQALQAGLEEGERTGSDALGELDQVLLLEPENLVALVAKAKILYERGSLRKAQRVINQALKLNRRHNWGWEIDPIQDKQRAGLIYPVIRTIRAKILSDLARQERSRELSINHQKGAEQTIHRALEWGPTDPWVVHAAVHIIHKRPLWHQRWDKRWQDAEEVAAALLAQEHPPEDRDGQFLYAQILHDLGKYPQARDVLEGYLLKRYPDWPPALKLLEEVRRDLAKPPSTGLEESAAEGSAAWKLEDFQKAVTKAWNEERLGSWLVTQTAEGRPWISASLEWAGSPLWRDTPDDVKIILLLTMTRSISRSREYFSRYKDLIKREAVDRETDPHVRGAAIRGLARWAETEQEQEVVLLAVRRLMDSVDIKELDTRRLADALSHIATRPAIELLERLFNEGRLKPWVTDVRRGWSGDQRVLLFHWTSPRIREPDFELRSSDPPPHFSEEALMRKFWDALASSPDVLREFSDFPDIWRPFVRSRPFWHPLQRAVARSPVAGLEEIPPAFLSYTRDLAERINGEGKFWVKLSPAGFVVDVKISRESEDAAGSFQEPEIDGEYVVMNPESAARAMTKSSGSSDIPLYQINNRRSKMLLAAEPDSLLLLTGTGAFIKISLSDETGTLIEPRNRPKWPLPEKKAAIRGLLEDIGKASGVADFRLVPRVHQGDGEETSGQVEMALADFSGKVRVIVQRDGWVVSHLPIAGPPSESGLEEQVPAGFLSYTMRLAEQINEQKVFHVQLDKKAGFVRKVTLGWGGELEDPTFKVGDERLTWLDLFLQSYALFLLGSDSQSLLLLANHGGFVRVSLNGPVVVLQPDQGFPLSEETFRPFEEPFQLFRGPEVRRLLDSIGQANGLEGFTFAPKAGEEFSGTVSLQLAGGEIIRVIVAKRDWIVSRFPSGASGLEEAPESQVARRIPLEVQEAPILSQAPLVMAQSGLLPEGVLTKFRSWGWRTASLPADLTEAGLIWQVTTQRGESPILVIVEEQLSEAVKRLPAYGRVTAVTLSPELASRSPAQWLISYLADVFRNLPGQFLKLEKLSEAERDEITAYSISL